MNWVIKNLQHGLQGTIFVSSDKSLTHRALLLASLASGESIIENPLLAGDTWSTIHCLQQLGIHMDVTPTSIHIIGNTWKKSIQPLDFGNTGTGIRLMSGILAGLSFDTIIDASEQMKKRPMKRVLEPLTQMGAIIQSEESHLPWHIFPSSLHGIEYNMTVASAQVKSAILLAGLFAKNPTTIIEHASTRDHTERMLQSLGIDIARNQQRITLTPNNMPHAFKMDIPGDFSSAAFWIASALLIPNSNLYIQNVNLNSTRTGFLDVLLSMGANIEINNVHSIYNEQRGNIHIKSSELHGVTVSGDTVVRMIDEFPIFAIVATQALGETIVQNAQELRVKETDRIATICTELRKMGITIQEKQDGFVLVGKQQLQPANLQSHNDHRLAMSLTVASLLAMGTSTIENTSCVNDSYPEFWNTLQKLL